MKPYILVISIVVFLISPLITTAAASEELMGKVANGIEALKRNQADSAMVFFWQASECGMSQDSFYYFLADVYISKGVFDTALALNYAIHPKFGSEFKRLILHQRYVIFTALDMHVRVEETLDSLWENKGYDAKDFLPGITLMSSMGYINKYDLHAIDYPWYRYEKEKLNTVTGLDYLLKISPSWRFPINRKQSILLATHFTYQKPYLAESIFADADSSEINGGFICGIDGLFKTMRITYEWERKRNYLNTLHSSNRINLTFSHLTNKVVFISSLMYGIDLGSKLHIDDHYVNITSTLTKFIGKMGRFTINTGMTALFMESLTFNNTLRKYPVIDFSKSLDSSSIPSMVILTLNSTTIRDTFEHNSVQIMPNTNIMVGPSLVYEHDIPRVCSIGFGFHWNLSYYLKPYSWSDYHLDSLNLMTRVVTQNADDQLYYWIQETSAKKSNITGDIFTYFTEGPIEQKGKKRIDNTLSLSLVVQKKFRHMGMLEIEGNVGKNWSTLDGELPVMIPYWSWDVTMQWRKYFSWR